MCRVPASAWRPLHDSRPCSRGHFDDWPTQPQGVRPPSDRYQMGSGRSGPPSATAYHPGVGCDRRVAVGRPGIERRPHRVRPGRAAPAELEPSGLPTPLTDARWAWPDPAGDDPIPSDPGRVSQRRQFRSIASGAQKRWGAARTGDPPEGPISPFNAGPCRGVTRCTNQRCVYS